MQAKTKYLLKKNNHSNQKEFAENPVKSRHKIKKLFYMSEELKSNEQVSQGGQTIGGQTIIVNSQGNNQSNGVGTAGFVLAIIAIFFGWVPFLGWILWALGLILSFAGVFKVPRGLAIAGLVISLIGIILLIAVFGAIFGGLAAMSSL